MNMMNDAAAGCADEVGLDLHMPRELALNAPTSAPVKCV